jgi:hypothetical protein
LCSKKKKNKEKETSDIGQTPSPSQKNEFLKPSFIPTHEKDGMEVYTGLQ